MSKIDDLIQGAIDLITKTPALTETQFVLDMMTKEDVYEEAQIINQALTSVLEILESM